MFLITIGLHQGVAVSLYPRISAQSGSNAPQASGTSHQINYHKEERVACAMNLLAAVVRQIVVS